MLTKLAAAESMESIGQLYEKHTREFLEKLKVGETR